MSQEVIHQTPYHSSNTFSIIKHLGSGKTTLYHAHDTRTNRPVVIKSFPVHSRIHEGYLREKTHLSDINHPHIIQLYEYVDMTTSTFGPYEEDVSYLVLEHSPFGDLLEVISTHGQMPEILVRTLFHQLIDALSYLHRKNVAHMDLKAENILLDDNYKLKLIDFDQSQSLDSKTIEVKGTLGYRAPEVKAGYCPNLIAADVYAAAVLLFILVTGYPPYTEFARGYGSDYDAYYKLMRSDIVKFWEIHAKHKKDENFYSEDFKDLVSWMLAEDPTNRPNLEDIVNSPWFQGPTLKDEDYQNEMKKYLRIVD